MKKKLALFLAIIVTITSILALAACSNNKKDDSPEPDNKVVTDLEYIKEKGKLIVGITEYAPMNYKDKKTDEWTGFDTEFAYAVAKKLGVEVEFLILDWEQKYVELNAKSIDCIWNGMTITDEGLKNASISSPYVKNTQVVVARKDVASKYTSIDQMKDLSFAVEGGSAGDKAAQKAEIKKIVKVTAQSDALTEVKSGASDACIIDITMANNMIGEGTSYADLTQICSLNEEEYGIAFRKGSDVTAKVNEIMAEMMKDGTLDDLAKKYDLTLVK